jgi:hypothetical protein
LVQQFEGLVGGRREIGLAAVFVVAVAEWDGVAVTAEIAIGL